MWGRQRHPGTQRGFIFTITRCTLCIGGGDTGEVSARRTAKFIRRAACMLIRAGCIKPTSDTGAPIAVWVSFIARTERIVGLASGIQQLKHGSPSSILPSQSSSMLVP